jgi:hypothetical protein
MYTQESRSRVYRPEFIKKKSVGRAKVVRVEISSFQTSKAIKRATGQKQSLKRFNKKAHDRK